MNIRRLKALAAMPPRPIRGKEQFWDDPHISKGMLEAHLNPNCEAASRREETITASVQWIADAVVPAAGAKILDLGCGPGLYASRLARLGYDIVGIDYSRRSIDYARDYARQHGLTVDYRYQNYLTIDFKEEYDAVLLIYCDFGALLDDERGVLLPKIHRALKPGGVFLFDVFTHHRRSPSDRQQSYEIVEQGFWSSQSYLALNDTIFYDEYDTFLDQTIVVGQTGEIKTYRIYDHVYDQRTIGRVLQNAGFSDLRFFGDVTGAELKDKSPTLAVLAKKE